MESKKNASVDLERKSGFFFSIGLLIAISLAITAFEWRHQSETISESSTRIYDPFELIKIPPTNIPPPQPPKPIIRNPILIEAKRDEKVDDIDIVIDFSKDSIELITAAPEPEREVVDETEYLFVEEAAFPENGMGVFLQFIAKNIQYPSRARRMGIEGKVFVEFVVQKDGSFQQVKVVRGIGAGCDEEALRVLQSAPPWQPARQRGKPVKQRFTLAINFTLQ